jgi:hypothetical protein
LKKAKKLPERTCTGCHETKLKKTLIRVVKTPDKDIVIDPTGKANGRGAYICPRNECLEAAMKTKRLTRALDVDISPDELKKLRTDLEAFIKASEG